MSSTPPSTTPDGPVHHSNCRAMQERYWRCNCGLDRLRGMETLARLVVQGAYRRSVQDQATDLTVSTLAWNRLEHAMCGGEVDVE